MKKALIAAALFGIVGGQCVQAQAQETSVIETASLTDGFVRIEVTTGKAAAKRAGIAMVSRSNARSVYVVANKEDVAKLIKLLNRVSEEMED